MAPTAISALFTLQQIVDGVLVKVKKTKWVFSLNFNCPPNAVLRRRA
jgi:hypothetical protein